MKKTALYLFIVFFILNSCDTGKKENSYTKQVLEWHDSIENIPKREFYLNNEQKKKGFYKSYHENGTTKSIFPLLNKKKHGVCKIFHPNGKIHIKVECKEGLEHGNYKIYNKTGELTIEGQYKDGKETGKWYYYNEDTLKRIKIYKTGEVVRIDTVLKFVHKKDKK